MLIDFHTHIYPDSLAHRIMAELSEKAAITPATNGTKDGQLDSMAQNDISCSVVLSIATNQKQTSKVNEFALSIKSDMLVPFCSVNPNSIELQQDLDCVLKKYQGLKLHPEYQGFFVGDKNCYKVVEKCVENDMIVVFHAGMDIGFPGSLNSPPKELARLVDTFRGGKIVLAHMGGFGMCEDVLEYLIGSDCFFDTAFLSSIEDKNIARKIIVDHGADKILFGSDCPWESPKVTYKYIKSLGLSVVEENKIFYQNAKQLLKLK